MSYFRDTALNRAALLCSFERRDPLAGEQHVQLCFGDVNGLPRLFSAGLDGYIRTFSTEGYEMCFFPSLTALRPPNRDCSSVACFACGCRTASAVGDGIAQGRHLMR